MLLLGGSSNFTVALKIVPCTVPLFCIKCTCLSVLPSLRLQKDMYRHDPGMQGQPLWGQPLVNEGWKLMDKFHNLLSSDGIILSCVLQCVWTSPCRTKPQLPRTVSCSLKLISLAFLFTLSTSPTHPFLSFGIASQIDYLSQGLFLKKSKLTQLHFPESLAEQNQDLSGLHSYYLNFDFSFVSLGQQC